MGYEHRRRNVSGQRGHPSQGRTEAIFKAGTIYHCETTLHLGRCLFSKIPQIWVIVFVGGSILRPLNLFSYILDLPKQLRGDLFVPAPVSVNVRDSKRDFGEGKGTTCRLKRSFLGLGSPQKTYKRPRCDLQGPWEYKTKCFCGIR